MFSIRTDLAIEAHEMLTESTSDIQGVACDTSRHNNIAVTRVTVSTEEAAKALGKPVGRYITLEFNELNLADAEYHGDGYGRKRYGVWRDGAASGSRPEGSGPNGRGRPEA